MDTHKNIARTTQALLLGTALALCTLAFAPPASAGGEGGAKMPLPATAAGIWSAIDQETQTLAALIKTGTLGTVHQHAFAIRDLVRALPERSSVLTPEQLKKVKANIKYVDALATRLDQSGDANDKAGTAASFEKLNAVLDTIRSNYGSK